MSFQLARPADQPQPSRRPPTGHGSGPPLRTVLLVADPAVGSLTGRRGAAVVELLAERLADGQPARAVTLADPVVIELAGLPLDIVSASDSAEPAPGTAIETLAAAEAADGALAAAVYAVANARLLVVAVPAAEVGPSGLLQRFLDLLPTDALGGTVAVTLLTVPRPTDRHRVQTRLTAALTDRAATVPTRGLTVVDSVLADVPAALASWAGLALTALRTELAGTIGSTAVWAAGARFAGSMPRLQGTGTAMDW